MCLPVLLEVQHQDIYLDLDRVRFSTLSWSVRKLLLIGAKVLQNLKGTSQNRYIPHGSKWLRHTIESLLVQLIYIKFSKWNRDFYTVHFPRLDINIHVQWNLSNPTSEFSDILWHLTKIYGHKVFLLTISCTIRHISLVPLCVELRQVPLL